MGSSYQGDMESGNSESCRVQMVRLTLSVLEGKIKRNHVFKNIQDLEKGCGRAGPDESFVPYPCAQGNLSTLTRDFWEHRVSLFPQKPLLDLLIKSSQLFWGKLAILITFRKTVLVALFFKEMKNLKHTDVAFLFQDH